MLTLGTVPGQDLDSWVDVWPSPPSDSLSDTFLGLFHYLSFLLLTWPLLVSGSFFLSHLLLLSKPGFQVGQRNTRSIQGALPPTFTPEEYHFISRSADPCKTA